MTRCTSLVQILLCAVVGLSIAAEARATNLITNGDFSSGNTGFTSEYTYVLGNGSATPEGTYSVVTTANDVHPAWGSSYDHTSNDESGQYFVANASSDTSKTVWQSNLISVDQANTPYRFEAWIQMIYPFESNPPSLSFEIGNGTTWTSLGQTIDLSDYDNYGPGEWYLTYADAQFGSTGTYYVRLKNSNGADGGNDLGLDDIYFGLRSLAPSYPGEPGVESPQVFNPATASVPEIDPAGMGSVLALVSGAFGLLERRRKRA